MNTSLTHTTSQFPQSRPGLAARLVQTLLTWQERSHQRHALAQLDGRGLADLGLSRADVAQETAKPFWRV